jgi:hypothetical protein
MDNCACRFHHSSVNIEIEMALDENQIRENNFVAVLPHYKV